MMNEGGRGSAPDTQRQKMLRNHIVEKGLSYHCRAVRLINKYTTNHQQSDGRQTCRSVRGYGLGGMIDWHKSRRCSVSTWSRVWFDFWHFLLWCKDSHCLTKCQDFRQFMQCEYYLVMGGVFKMGHCRSCIGLSWDLLVAFAVKAAKDLVELASYHFYQI